MGLFSKKEELNYNAPIGSELSFSSSEAFNLVRTNIRFSLVDKEGANIIAVTSPTPNDGKTYTAINIAYSLSRFNVPVLLMDCDLRKPSVGKRLGVINKEGLTDAVVNGTPLIVNKYIMGGYLSFVNAGQIPPNPSEILASDGTRRIIETLSKKYKYIVLDLPPIEIVPDAMSLADIIDGVVVVTRNGVTQKRSIKSTVSQLQFAGMKILGFVYNCYGLKDNKHYYSSSKYYDRYYKSYEYKQKK